MLPIIRTARADEDLIDIWAYIAAKNPAAADRVLDAIEARRKQLAHHPYSGFAPPRWPEIPPPLTRSS